MMTYTQMKVVVFLLELTPKVISFIGMMIIAYHFGLFVAIGVALISFGMVVQLMIINVNKEIEKEMKGKQQ